MLLSDAKQLIGRTCAVSWLDRTGNEVRTVSRIHDATFVPLYGGFLVTDCDDIRLDRVTSIHILAEDGSAVPLFDSRDTLPAAA